MQIGFILSKLADLQNISESVSKQATKAYTNLTHEKVTSLDFCSKIARPCPKSLINTCITIVTISELVQATKAENNPDLFLDSLQYKTVMILLLKLTTGVFIAMVAKLYAIEMRDRLYEFIRNQRPEDYRGYPEV